MNARSTWLGLAALASAALTIAAAPWALDAPWLNFVFKPLTTLLVIAHAWPRGRDTPILRRGVLIGLALSLAGDVFLMWPAQGFLPGLVSFLLAHLAYLWAFTRVARFAAWWPAFAFYAVTAGSILTHLWPGVGGGLQVPVAVYVLALASMAAQAAVVMHARRGQPDAARARILALGGALFIVSDATLAINKFLGAVPMSGLWILATYWAAQWCIASWLAPGRHAPDAHG